MMPIKRTFQPLETVTVPYKGQNYKAQLVGIYTDHIHALVSFKYGNRPLNVAILISEIEEVKNGTASCPLPR